MYRVRQTVLVKYGKFRDYFDLIEKIDAVCRDRDWAEPKYWVPLAGQDNEITVERQYASLEEWTRENETWHKDEEVMNLVRKASDLVEPGTSRSFIEEEAFQIA